MNLSEPFIVRPIATSLVMAAFLFTGVLAYKLLAVSALPEVDYPTIQVATFYPGASPSVMATMVTGPLERQFGQMPGLNQMNSTSSSTASMITLQFSLNISLDIAEQEVQAAINAASAYLPQSLPGPPVYSKVNPADPPILTLALSSKTMPLRLVEDLADTRFAQKIAQLSGVGLVSINGGQRPAIRIQADPNALAAYGLSLENIRTAVATANVNTPKGSFNGEHQTYMIDANDQLLKSEEYQTLIIAYNNGAPIYLSDVATIKEDVENVQLAAWMNTEPAVILNIQRQPGSNVIEVVDRIKELLPKLKATLPSAVEVSILTDRTDSIRASFKEVKFDLVLSVILVVVVIFVFIGSFKATIIPSAAVPISLIGTFGAMYLLEFSLNNITLMALTIATGFVVDDAIVMIENISRYVEKGETPINAALKGAKQIGFTILSLTASLIAVLIPLLFMQDIVGRLFRQFAVTVSVTILISAFVSLTLTPMLCVYFLAHNKEKAKDRLDFLIEYYRVSLDWVLRHQKLVISLAAITVCCTGILLVFIPKGFFPIQDTGVILGISESDQSISFKTMVERQQNLAKIILQDAAVLNLSSFIGIDGTNTTLNSGRLLITLKPIEERNFSASEVIERLKVSVASVPNINLYMQPVQDLSIDDRVSRTQYQYSLNSPDPALVSQWTKRLLNKLQQEPSLQDLASSQQDLGLQTLIKIDHDAASRFGISTQMIDDSLYNAFGQRQVATLFTQLNQYHVVLEMKPELQNGLKTLDNVYLNSPTGKAIPLRSFTEISQSLGPLSIQRKGQFPVAILSFNLTKDAALGDAINAIKEATTSLEIPESVQTEFEGAAKIFQNSLANEGWLMLAAIFVVYIVLGVLYESYIHPITILSTLPSAAMGALCSLWLTGHSLSVIALIGIILLVGIVMKNAIMMIDFALELERLEGKTALEAINEACLLRFRPILMTTLAAMFGAVPLALGSGMGSELRQPLGIAIIGGLILSQLLTLYTTPVIYLAFDRLAKKIKELSNIKGDTLDEPSLSLY